MTIDQIVEKEKCEHYPMRVYEWPMLKSMNATCAKCNSDYQLIKLENVTYNGFQVYWAGGK